MSSEVSSKKLANNVAVSVKNISKCYTVARRGDGHSTAAEALMHRLRHPFSRANTEKFWALKDVSFEICKGDVIGIIGRNGAGKSTLLKILSRITEPTQGEAALRGRVGSLLEVGTGFHPELTGRENIFLNGAILGMSRREINHQFDAIVDFAGTERFLETPVKRYSSGMYVRLAFSVAAHLNSEIMIVDEVLAVGDAEFQKKCLGKMQDVASGGRTVLFVSHNIAAVTNLCTKALFLKNGTLSFFGDTHEAQRLYLTPEIKVESDSEKQIQDFRPSWAKPLISGLRVLDSEGRQQSAFPLGSDITFELTFQTPKNQEFRNPVMGIVINHATAGIAGGVNTRVTGFSVEWGVYGSGVLRCRIARFPFLQGSYTADIMLGDGPDDLDLVNGYLSFSIEPTDLYGSGQIPSASLGITFLDPAWQFDQMA